MPKLILASGSPRRADLLQAAGLAFTVMPVSIDETPIPGEPPVQMCRRLAEAKARHAAQAKGGAVVLGADTTVWFAPDEPPIGKPRDRDHARATLARLTAGEPHFVTTGYAIVGGPPESTPHIGEETTRVWMRTLDPGRLEDLLDAEEWHDKAGGYAIQGRAGALVTRIEGSYSNVVGLPVAQVLAALEPLMDLANPQEGV